MKRFSIFLLTIIAVIGMSSCEHDDDVVFVAQPDPEGVAFTNSFSANYMLNSASSSNLAERFVWNEVDFGTPTTVTYELQGSPSQDFSGFDPIGTSSETNLGVTIAQMMSLAADAGLDNDPATEDKPNTGTIYFRVRAFAGTDGGNGLEEISEVAAINVTLPEATEEEEETKMNLFLVGDATAAGWDNNNNNTPLFRDSDNDDLYYFTGYFAAGFYKFLEGPAWAPQYGYDGSTLVYRATEDDPDPSSIEIVSAGYYTITVNIDDLSFSMETFDESAADSYDKIGLVGAGTTVGWPGDDNPTPDILLTKSTFDPHIWYVKDVELSEDGIKFRANLAWDVNWGGGENFPSGQATGDDIIVSKAGTYNVWFNDLTGRYLFIEQTPAE